MVKKKAKSKVKKAAKILPLKMDVVREDETFSSPVWQGCLLWYSASAYNFISSNDFEVVKSVVLAADEFSQHEPLHMRGKDGSFPKIILPILGEKSGPYCIALIGSFLVWTQKQLADNELPDSPVLRICNEALNFWKLDHG